MSNYVDKVRDKNHVEAELRDSRLPEPTAQDADKVVKVNAQGEYALGIDSAKDVRIPDATAQDAGKVIKVADDGTYELGEGGSTVYLNNTSLVIPEQPEPVINVDGVDYYHKQEFNLEELIVDAYYDVLTGEIEQEVVLPVIYLYNSMAQLRVFGGGSMALNNTYTSRAFAVVDTQGEVTNNTKICLPTCSAYYGYLSEDGKTFISYYNLKSDGGAPTKVNAVKQGNNTIPVVDERLPEAPSAEAGKVLKVAEAGGYELGEAGGGGTQLYYHRISNVKRIRLFTGFSEITDFEFISTRSTPFTTMHVLSLNEMIASAHRVYFSKGGPGYNLIGVIEYRSSYNSTSLDSETYYYDNPDEGTINDTVTPL